MREFRHLGLVLVFVSLPALAMSNPLPAQTCPVDGSFLTVSVTARPAASLPEQQIEVIGSAYNPSDFTLGNVQLSLRIKQNEESPILVPSQPPPFNTPTLPTRSHISHTWTLRATNPGWVDLELHVSGEIWCGYFYYVGNTASTRVVVFDPESVYQTRLPIIIR